MIRPIVALLLVIGLVTPVAAAPRKVLVLPLDGNAPAETRKKLSASFQKMARVLDGDVQAGNTSLGDTATAIGCDPQKPSCVENVRATLGVDELVYGTADEADGTITIVAKRYRKSKPVRELAVTQPSTEPPNKIEPQLLPVFGEEPLPTDGTTTTVTEPNTTVTDPNATTTTVTDPNQQPTDTIVTPSSNRERNIWIGVTAGGGVLLALGFTLWLSASSLQDDIDNADTSDNGDIDRLKELEDKASSRGWAGNIFVVAGLAVAGYGGYRLWKLSRSKAVVTPTPTEGGAAVTLTIVGDLW
ncbi:MAG: hypothetical protein M4D80_35225 [Myxococcota bacterium]|nr:hypothetical protein [Myxococcota bacterium]